MTTGNMRFRFTLQRRTIAEDASMGMVGAWSDVATFWGQLEQTSNREALVTRSFDRRMTHTVTLRFGKAFTVERGMRLVCAARTFNVHDVRNVDEKKKFVRLFVEEDGLLTD